MKKKYAFAFQCLTYFRSLLSGSALALLPVAAATASSLPPPTGPATSSSGTYTISYQYSGDTVYCSWTYLDESPAGESAWTIVPDYNHDGAVTISGKPPGLYEYRTRRECETPSSESTITSSSITVQIGGTPTVDTMDIQESYEFVVRYGDISGDGRRDFFLQRTAGGQPGNGVISEVFLVQAPDKSFYSDRRTSYDRARAATWPVGQARVDLLDINLDGFVDVIARNLNADVPGTPPLIAFSSGKLLQEQAANVVALDSQFDKMVEELRGFYLNKDYFHDNAIWVERTVARTTYECEYYWWGDTRQVTCTPYTEYVDVSYWSYEHFERNSVEVAETIERILNGENVGFEDVIAIFEEIIGVSIGSATGVGCTLGDDLDSSETCPSQIVSILFVRLVNALEDLYSRDTNTIHVTGRMLAFDGTYHTALEYRSDSGVAEWYSGFPNKNWLDPTALLFGFKNDERDDPRNMIVFGTVTPAASVAFSVDQLNRRVRTYKSNCNDYKPTWQARCPLYALLPTDYPFSRNSNSFTSGLIQIIGGIFEPRPNMPNPNTDFGVGPAPGWKLPVPKSYFY